MARYIFITGGVVSSLGKGLCSASLGALLQARGFKVRLRKLDPYLNVDPGTMSPYQHGEVFVTDDGAPHFKSLAVDKLAMGLVRHADAGRRNSRHRAGGADHGVFIGATDQSWDYDSHPALSQSPSNA